MKSTKTQRTYINKSNYQATVDEWNESYGDKVGMCIYDKMLDEDRPTPMNRLELLNIIRYRIEKYGNDCDLNDIDISNVKSLLGLFAETEFNGDISQWDASYVMNMQSMFADSKFNQDISMWNINPQCQTYGMFDNCPIRNEFKPMALQNKAP